MYVKKKRTRGQAKALIVEVPERLVMSVRAAAAAMGFTEADIVQGGIVLYCTYILGRVPGVREAPEGAESKVKKWLPKEVAEALASSFVSKRRPSGGSSGSRRARGGQSPILSVGSVLRESLPLGPGKAGLGGSG